MPSHNTALETLDATLRRYPFIETLNEEVMDKRTLVEELECSRSTVNRAVRELEALNLVEYSDGGYHITPLGEEVTNGFNEVSERVELRLKFEPFLQWMPECEFDLELERLKDAELVIAETGDPYRVINQHIKRLKEMNEGYFLLPFAGMHATEIAYDRVVHKEAECEVIIAPAVEDLFKDNPNYVKPMKEMIETGRLKAFRTSTEMPFSLGIIDDRVQLIGDEDEEPRALVETRNSYVRNWVEYKFQEYKQQAEPVAITAESAQVQS